MHKPSRFGGQKVAERAKKLRLSLDDLECDAIIITHLPNIRWLTGFSGSNGFVVVSHDHKVLYTDTRYNTSGADELEASASGFELVVSTKRDGDLYREALTGAGNVGFEAESMIWGRHQTLVDSVPDVCLVPTHGMCEKLRRYKDTGERRLLTFAAWIADQALAKVVPDIVPGRTEKEVAAELEEHMRRCGADKAAYDTIVASGPNSALPHATPTDRKFEVGDLLIVDVGARFCGYGSDMTRTYVVGADPTVEQQSWYGAVLHAQQAGIEAISENVDERNIDLACRRVLAGYGLEDAFIHGTGHGIGLEIHEDPVLSPRSLGTLQSGLVITVEPGVYFPGTGGVRIEDAVVMEESGCSTITTSPKSLLPQPTS